MDPITSRNRSRSVSADAYWRRRLFALAIGLAVLGLLAWAVGGAAARPTAATTPLHHHHAPNQSGPAAGASLTPSPSPSPSPSGTGQSQQHKHHGNHASQATKPKAKHTPSAAAAGAHTRAGDCRAADVVLTLTETSNSYGPGAQPQFGIDVVSTASQTCTFNVGTRHLTLLVKSGGVRVWNSADCAGKSGASSVTKLKRGVPLQLQTTWGRRLSSPGCKAPRAAAPSGAYTVTASAGQLHSHTLVFDLR